MVALLIRWLNGGVSAREERFVAPWSCAPHEGRSQIRGEAGLRDGSGADFSARCDQRAIGAETAHTNRSFMATPPALWRNKLRTTDVAPASEQGAHSILVYDCDAAWGKL